MSVQEQLELLGRYKSKYFEMGEAVLSADGGSIYPLDLLIVAALNRSLCLQRGFIALIQEQNFIAAAPIIRLQLDNCLRVFAGTLVNDPHDLAIKILEGVPVRKQRDRSNQLMTDRYLVSKLSKQFIWITNVYETTSGYIHLSEKHMFNAMHASDGNKLTLKITEKDEFVPDSLYDEALRAFIAITDILFEHINGWVFTKNNPVMAAQMRGNQ